MQQLQQQQQQQQRHRKTRQKMCLFRLLNGISKVQGKSITENKTEKNGEKNFLILFRSTTEIFFS